VVDGRALRVAFRANRIESTGAAEEEAPPAEYGCELLTQAALAAVDHVERVLTALLLLLPAQRSVLCSRDDADRIVRQAGAGRAAVSLLVGPDRRYRRKRKRAGEREDARVSSQAASGGRREDARVSRVEQQ
jgi:hypothetical protein